MNNTSSTSILNIESNLEMDDGGDDPSKFDYGNDGHTTRINSADGTFADSEPPSQEDYLNLPALLCDEKLLEEIQSIPNKMGFKIGDVAELLGVKQYVLRYWENEFKILRPKKAANNQRCYTRKDVENIFIIRKLLHRDRFSIEGAQAALSELKLQVRRVQSNGQDWQLVHHRLETSQDQLEELINDIRRIKKILMEN